MRFTARPPDRGASRRRDGVVVVLVVPDPVRGAGRTLPLVRRFTTGNPSDEPHIATIVVGTPRLPVRVRLRPPEDRASYEHPHGPMVYRPTPRGDERTVQREASPVPIPQLAFSVFPFHHAPWSGTLRSGGGVNAPAASSRLVRE